LTPRQFNAGYAEVAKYGLIGDAPFFAWLESNWRAVAAGRPERQRAIAVCCRAKAATVAADERDQSTRALLNFGHTFAHALESAAGYDDRLVHGEAVAIGMRLAFEFSARLRLCSPDDVDRVAKHLAEVGLPTEIGDIPGERLGARRLMDLMAQDKKVSRGRLTFILTRGIGRAFVANDVSPAEVLAFLEEKVAG
jgi:3-dehydroquinate synthase